MARNLPPGFGRQSSFCFFAWLSLGGVHWRADLPFEFSGDYLFYLAQSKATIDHAGGGTTRRWARRSASMRGRLPRTATSIRSSSASSDCSRARRH
jgi:hypothetical protein